jgi:hypothetical protein
VVNVPPRRARKRRLPAWLLMTGPDAALTRCGQRERRRPGERVGLVRPRRCVRSLLAHSSSPNVAHRAELERLRKGGGGAPLFRVVEFGSHPLGKLVFDHLPNLDRANSGIRHLRRPLCRAFERVRLD